MKFKQFLCNKKVRAVLLSLCLMSIMCVACFAVEGATPDSGITTAFQTGLDGIKTDFMGLVAVALPVGIAIFAAFFGIRKGMQFFKSVSK